MNRAAAKDENEGVLAKKDDALTGAAVSAAVGLAVYGLRKALDRAREEHSPWQHFDEDEPRAVRLSRGAALLPAVWESGSEALLPLAEHAAVAAGKWVAENSPAVVRDRLLPRFIESFEDAA